MWELAEPLMESNCLLPEAARLHLDEPQVQLFTGAPSPTGQGDHQGDWGASCHQPTGAGSLFMGPERKITPLGTSSMLGTEFISLKNQCRCSKEP